MLLFRHALRVSEVITLRWEQVDMTQGLLHIVLKMVYQQLICQLALNFDPLLSKDGPTTASTSQHNVRYLSLMAEPTNSFQLNKHE